MFVDLCGKLIRFPTNLRSDLTQVCSKIPPVSLKGGRSDNVASLGIIRRWHLRDQVLLRERATRLGISRNTAPCYLRSEITGSSYAERRATSGLDKYSVQLSGWLKAEVGKSRKQRDLKQIHGDLKNWLGWVTRPHGGHRQTVEGGAIGPGQFGEQTNTAAHDHQQSLVIRD